jgi:hypothetical protein
MTRLAALCVMAEDWWRRNELAVCDGCLVALAVTAWRIV